MAEEKTINTNPLRVARAKHNLTQQALADLLSVDRLESKDLPTCWTWIARLLSAHGPTIFKE